jgi:hypothetical protein
MYSLRDFIKIYKKKWNEKTLAINIIDMLKEFNKLKFKKIDIRCKDIFVQQDGSLKIIDPKKCFSKERNLKIYLHNNRIISLLK